LRRPLESTQYTAIRFTEHLTLEGIAPSGAVGDAYDALMETVIGLFKTECITTTVLHHGPHKTIADVEYAAMDWVNWYNTRRLHSSIGFATPLEHEAASPSRRDRLWPKTLARTHQGDRPARAPIVSMRMPQPCTSRPRRTFEEPKDREGRQRWPRRRNVDCLLERHRGRAARRPAATGRVGHARRRGLATTGTG
jgi:hypothetical protein